MAVANSIGRFILMEQEQLTGAEKRPPRMLVEIDSSEGLPGEIEIVWEGGVLHPAAGLLEDCVPVS